MPKKRDDPAISLSQVEQVLDRWLYLEDYDLIRVILATVVANRVPGDPLWLIAVSPPSTGKTETLSSIAGLADVHMVSTITEAGLLSGSPRKDASDASTGGLLRQIGDFGIIVCKDFGSILEAHRTTRGRLLMALREIYDGRWDRVLGTDVGKTLPWQGRVGLLAACTAAIDSAHSVMSLMGERFVLFRQMPVDEEQQALKAVELRGREVEMRAELASVVEGFLGALTLPEVLPEMSEVDTKRLIALARFVAHARAGVERDNYSKAIVSAPEPEGPSRLVKQFQRLFGGLTLIGVEHDEAMRLVLRVGADCIPRIRHKLVSVLRNAPQLNGSKGEDESLTRQAICDATPYSMRTIENGLEDLELHGLIESEHAPDRRTSRFVYSYTLSTLARRLLSDMQSSRK